MVGAFECDRDQTLLHHVEHKPGVLQVERGFGQDRLARQERFGNAGTYANRPTVVDVVAVGERDEKTSIGNALHVREKPFLVDSVRGPLAFPAKRMNDCAVPDFARAS